LYKTFFATNFVENICKFYNFERNNYLLIKILRKNDNFFFIISFNKFVKKISSNMRISSSIRLRSFYILFVISKNMQIWKKKSTPMYCMQFR